MILRIYFFNKLHCVIYTTKLFADVRTVGIGFQGLGPLVSQIL